MGERNPEQFDEIDDVDALLSELDEAIVRRKPLRFDLDEHQRKVCDADARFIRVLAPAGTGKTRVLTCKAVDTVLADPIARVLCVTFTKAGAAEMRERVHSTPAIASRDIEFSTVNAFAYGIVRESWPNVLTIQSGDYPRELSSLIHEIAVRHRLRDVDDDPSRDFTDAVLDACAITEDLGFSHTRSLEKTQEHYDKIKRWGLHRALSTVFDEIEGLPGSAETAFSAWYSFWSDLVLQMMSVQGLMTFSGQKYWARHLLGCDDVARARLERRGYTHLYVDEFQDINPLDLLLVAKIVRLCGTRMLICGDDDQCIFEWRGCTSHFILTPRTISKTCGSDDPFYDVILHNNYRSPRNIVVHSTSLIRHNDPNRVEKHPLAMNQRDAGIRVLARGRGHVSVETIAKFVVRVLRTERTQRIALLSRTRDQLVPFQLAFARQGVAFQIDEDLDLFHTERYQDFISMMSLPPRREVVQPAGECVDQLLVCVRRLYRWRLRRRAIADLQTHMEYAHPTTLHAAVEALASYNGQMKGPLASTERAAERILEFLQAQSPAEAVAVLKSSFYGFGQTSLYRRRQDRAAFADTALGYLAEMAVQYGSSFGNFRRDLDRASGKVAPSRRAAARCELMTALRAKGREFDTVVIPDVVEGIWPHANSVRNGCIEEERRLFYVAVTRATSNLILCAMSTMSELSAHPSRFLDEMDLPVSAWLRDPEPEDHSSDGDADAGAGARALASPRRLSPKRRTRQVGD